MRKYFCENCGCQLTLDDRFCENCGHPVPTGLFDTAQNRISGLEDDIFIFSQKDWEKRWKGVAQTYGCKNLGIILINTDGQENKLTEFLQTVKDYIVFRKERGIHYYILDLSNEVVSKKRSPRYDHVVALLKEVYQKAKPKYLFILGDNKAIGSAKWDNPSYSAGNGDHDKYVDSDLPYVTLDTEAPQKGQDWSKFDFERVGIRVGRVPARKATGFAEACRYLKNAIRLDNTLREIRPFALLMKAAEKSDEQIFQSSRYNVVTSPKYWLKDCVGGGISRLNSGIEPNVLLFDLHGCDTTYFWYGDNGKGYKPETFSSDCLPFGDSAYFIGTMSCYGAKPNAYEEGKDEGNRVGILNKALKNGCLAFLGSTQIAYGPIDGENLAGEMIPSPVSCAVILVGEFTNGINRGLTAGDAYIFGLKELTKKNKLKDAALKTLAEFALYGDPVAGFKTAQSMNPLFFEQDDDGSFNTEIHIPMPDVRRAVRLKLAIVNQTIAKKVTDFVVNYYEEFSTVIPTYCEMTGCGGYQAIYSKDDGPIQRIMKIYFDAQGNIEEVLHSI